MQISGYSLLKAYHPNNIKRGGVCICFKESLPLIRRDDLTNLKDCVITKINVNNEKCLFTCLYRSLSQNHNGLEHLCTNFDLFLSNFNNLYPTCSIVLGDFNAKCSKWCASDKSNTTGIELDNITMTSGYNQMIDKPTHYINESSSCIDLIFSSNVNLTKNCGVEQSLYEKCRHNIIYGTLNFNILLPPPYYRELWDFKSANTECIQKSINNFDWDSTFQNQNCTEQCRILSETLYHIFRNFIPPKNFKN